MSALLIRIVRESENPLQIFRIRVSKSGWLACLAVSEVSPTPPRSLSLWCRPHCGKNYRIFRDAADQMLPVTKYSEIDNWLKFSVIYFGKFSYMYRLVCCISENPGVFATVQTEIVSISNYILEYLKKRETVSARKTGAIICSIFLNITGRKCRATVTYIYITVL
jgi:hypothetical protein